MDKFTKNYFDEEAHQEALDHLANYSAEHTADDHHSHCCDALMAFAEFRDKYIPDEEGVEYGFIH